MSIYANVGETSSVSVTTTEDVSATAVTVVVETSDLTDVGSIADGSLTKTATTVAFALSSAMTASERTLRYSVRKDADGEVVASGSLFVTYKTQSDS